MRPMENGDYEMISGHCRRYASMLAEKETMPVIIREMNDDTATILMVDSNLQREHILPSERAKACQMKMEALKHQDERKDLQKGGEGTSRQVFGKLEASDIIGQGTGESGRQVQRYLRLNSLIPEIQDLVDDKKIVFIPAVELSYLSTEEQKEFIQAMEEAQTSPSLSQAQRLKKASQEGRCTLDVIRSVMDEEKKSPMDLLVLDGMSRITASKAVLPERISAVELKLHKSVAEYIAVRRHL